MTPQQFETYMHDMGWSNNTLARLIGKHPSTIALYRTKGVPKTIAGVVELALLALKHGHRIGGLSE